MAQEIKICPASWEVYMKCVRAGKDEMARMTMKNIMAREFSHSFPFLGWGPLFRIGSRRWL